MLVTFILLSSFTVLNMLIGLLCEVVDAVAEYRIQNTAAQPSPATPASQPSPTRRPIALMLTIEGQQASQCTHVDG